MQRRLIIFLLLMSAGLFLFALQYDVFTSRTSLAITNPSAPRERLLLIPLDSRPPCRDFVRDAAGLVDYQLLLPPAELMDYYSAPGDIQGMRKWLADNAAQTKLAIISIDQLLCGGLLASREGPADTEKIAELLNYLRHLHQANPDVKLQAFSILPRLLPPDSIDGAEERKALLRYSRLMDKADLQQGRPEAESEELAELRAAIPAPSLAHYEALFQRHLALCHGLIQLVQEGVLDRLLIGRDDSGAYGLPNTEARRLLNALRQSGLPDERAALTYGADELALTLLAAHAARTAQIKPQIFLAYNDEHTPARLLPYMGGSLQTTAEEKIALVGGQQAASPDTADFTLFISAVGSDSLDSRRPAALTVKKLLQQERSLALVDLSEHFTSTETLMPQMLREHVPLQNLTAYAGWNTASNAIGTAVAHAVLAQAGRKLAADSSAQQRVIACQLTLLNQRFLEDSFYLKDIIDKVNYSLRGAGYNDVNDLDMAHNYHWANALMQTGLAERRQRFELSPSFRLPRRDALTAKTFYVQRLKEEAYYPWPRTFEINLTVRPQIYLGIP